MFRHKGCNGQVLISLSEKMSIVSPGVQFSERGVRPGITEVKLFRDKSKAEVSYLCSNCSKEFGTEKELEEIEVRCDADDMYHPVTEITATENYMFCENCQRIILGDSESSDEHLLHLREVLSIPNSCNRVPLSKVMLRLVK